MLRNSCGSSFVLLLAVSAHASRVTSVEFREGNGEHPSLSVPSSASIAVDVRTNGARTRSSSGMVSYKRHTWYLAAVSDHWIDFQEKPLMSGGTLAVAKRHATFVGWNNLMTRMVTRYLWWKDYDKDHFQIGSRCLMYKEEGPKGYIDPFIQVQARGFWGQNKMEHFVQDPSQPAEGGLEFFKMASTMTSHDMVMVGDMVTEADGKNTRNATLTSTAKDYETTFSVVYSDRKDSTMEDHEEIIYQYQADCETVQGFHDVPQVCLDELLAVEYECGQAELRHAQ
eukprot:Skav208769  [mRNA]  locus=scaffold4121:74599:77552:+ [translate_table: standard]